MSDLKTIPGVLAASAGQWRDTLLFTQDGAGAAIAACEEAALAVFAVVQPDFSPGGSNDRVISLDGEIYIEPRNSKHWNRFVHILAGRGREFLGRADHPPDATFVLVAATFDEYREILNEADEARLRATKPPRSAVRGLLNAGGIVIAALVFAGVFLRFVDIVPDTPMWSRALRTLGLLAFAVGFAFVFGREAWANRRDDKGGFFFVAAIVVFTVGYALSFLVG